MFNQISKFHFAQLLNWKIHLSQAYKMHRKLMTQSLLVNSKVHSTFLGFNKTLIPLLLWRKDLIISRTLEGQEVISDDLDDEDSWMSGWQGTSQDDIGDDDNMVTGQVVSSLMSRHANIIIMNIIYTPAHNLESPLS